MSTILCVDDSPRTLRLLSALLHLCGHRVLTAANPDAALQVAARSRIDLAILDYQLPDRSGTSLARGLKRVKPGLPIMLFSGALPVATDELDAVDECVPKGESVDDMLHKVHELLQPLRYRGHMSKQQPGRVSQTGEHSRLGYSEQGPPLVQPAAPVDAVSGEHK